MKIKIYSKIAKRIWVFLFRKTILGNFIVGHARKKAKIYALNEREYSILQDLQSDGISMFPIDTILCEHDKDKIFKHVLELTHAKPKKSTKTFLEYYIGGFFPQKKQIFSLNDPLFNLAVNESLLKIISNYLQADSKLCYIELNRTLVQPKQEKQLSQKAHRDPGLHKCIKVFIYFNDVTAEDGPFNFIPQTHITGAKNSLLPNVKSNAGSYYLSQELESLLNDNKLKSCVGAKGTVIVCDTTGWHFGGNSKCRPRTMSTFVYYPNFEIIKSKLIYYGAVSDLSDLQHSFLNVSGSSL